MYKVISDKPPTLEEMHEFVGGYIEIVTLRNGDQLVLDEDGKLKQKEINMTATSLFHQDFGAHDVIVGDVLHLKGKGRCK